MTTSAARWLTSPATTRSASSCTGLDPDDLSALVRERIASTAGRDVSPVADRLHAETAGNPLFAEHLLRHWSGSDQLDVADDVVTLAVPAAVDVPSSLRDLVWYRVKVLGPDAQPTLTAAAVLGLQFNERVLARMTGLADHDVGRVLDRAVAAGILADQASISGNVRFAHALVGALTRGRAGDPGESRAPRPGVRRDAGRRPRSSRRARAAAGPARRARGAARRGPALGRRVGRSRIGRPGSR